MFATCTATEQNVVSELIDQVPADHVSCDHNHRVEILGRLSDLPAITDEGLDQSCAELARWLTRMPDPTAGGLLAAWGGLLLTRMQLPGRQFPVLAVTVLPRASLSPGVTGSSGGPW